MNTTDIKSQLFGLINQIEDEEMHQFIIEVIKRLKDQGKPSPFLLSSLLQFFPALSTRFHQALRVLKATFL